MDEDKDLPVPASPPAVPARRRADVVGVARKTPASGGELPNASLIYGVAAAALFAIGLFFLVQGRWVSGLLLLLPAGCCVGYALHYLKGVEW